MLALHLGCGQNVIPGWVNYDLEPGPGGIVHDLTRALPVGDATADYIFSEHFIEHITRDQALHLLRECHRALKVGGTLRITTPDLCRLVAAYVDDVDLGIPGIWEPKTPCQQLNEALRLWGHQFVYDEMELGLLFVEAGFSAPSMWGHRKSTHAPLNDREHRPFTTEVCMEATKA